MSVPKRITGSQVELRARVLRLLYSIGVPLDEGQIAVKLIEDVEDVRPVLTELQDAGIIVRRPDRGHPKNEALPETPWGLPTPFSRKA